MRISAITTCVGEPYLTYLTNALPVWRATVDRLVIVTDAETFAHSNFFPHECVVTDIFTQHGASFNKGAALSQGFAVADPQDWVLNFDADVLPPYDWRVRVKNVSPGRLFGCSHRLREDGSQIPDANFPNIWGFFHLWHVLDPHSWRRPVFDSSCGHAGNYDHIFMMQWEPQNRVDLWPELLLVHQGEPRQHWFGKDPKNDKKMANLFTLGLWDAWLTRAGHIKIPDPEEIIWLESTKDPQEVFSILRKYTDTDPFKYRVALKDSLNGAPTPMRVL